MYDLGAHSHYYTKQDLPEAFVSINSVSYEVEPVDTVIYIN